MAIRAGSRPAAVGDRHWSHTQWLGAEGKAIHPFCAQPCSHSWPYCTLASPSNYSRPDCRMKQIKLKGEYAELLIHDLVPFRWGLEIYIQGLFIIETGHPKLKPHTASCYSEDASGTNPDNSSGVSQKPSIATRNRKLMKYISTAGCHSVVWKMFFFCGGCFCFMRHHNVLLSLVQGKRSIYASLGNQQNSHRALNGACFNFMNYPFNDFFPSLYYCHNKRRPTEASRFVMFAHWPVLFSLLPCFF